MAGRSAVGDSRQAGRRPGCAAAGGQQGAFGGTVRIAEFDAHQEAVELRFGQREGADLMHRVLRGDDEERARQRWVCPSAVTWPFFHRFEQGALRLGRGAVDLVGEHQLREQGPGRKRNALCRARRSNPDIGRQQVAGELDARELQAKQRASVGQRRLAHAGQVSISR